MQDFTITTLGCKVNQYDSSAIAKALQQAGLQKAKRANKTDLLVVNTCCVTTTAMRKSRQMIRQALRKSPNAIIIIVGCYATYHENRISEMLDDLKVPTEQRLIIGHHDDIASKLETLLIKQSGGPERTKKIKKIPATMQARRTDALSRQAVGAEHLPSIDQFPGHQRAFVKVQDGCDAFCSYCIVCYTRPRVTSRNFEKIQAECSALLQSGHKEIVLCGVFLGAFGQSTAIRRRWPTDQPSQLPKLLASIADIPGLWRVRLSSLEPGDLTDELLDVATGHQAVAPHFHLPLQSGSEKILKRMNRQYSPEEFRQTVDRLRDRLDRPAITTDIIVGFPGEGEDEFTETLAMAREAGFAKIHAFPFSAIEPTAAWRYRDEAPQPAVVRERLTRLNELEKNMARQYREQFIGCELEGLVESTIPKPAEPSASGIPSLRQAMTDRYMTVTFDTDDFPHSDITGQIVKLKINSATPTGLAGTFCNIDE